MANNPFYNKQENTKTPIEPGKMQTDDTEMNKTFNFTTHLESHSKTERRHFVFIKLVRYVENQRSQCWPLGSGGVNLLLWNEWRCKPITFMEGKLAIHDRAF